LKCEALELERCTNQQLRPSAIRSLKRGRIGDRNIMKFSGGNVRKPSITFENFIQENQKSQEMSQLLL